MLSLRPVARIQPLLCFCLGLGLAAGSAQSAEVWKCQVGKEIKYSDQPCQSQGEPMRARQLQGNVVDTTSRILPSKDAAASERADMAAPPTATLASICPSEAELAAMETRASSITLEPEAKAFMQDEIRRARQCRKGQGRYSAADWEISRRSQAAQSNLSGAADARRRAEDMHSAADPFEGDRIAQQRTKQREQEQALRLKGPTAPLPIRPPAASQTAK
ncbi:hypothetical protein [Paucibacter sp. Y2R2-4]|uniref:hypothetical protein n=1 Tax=Paucibacter sp. Y2R2-4 TaxID=2893553 RepID=UPI0021E3A50D|nr:hypothetical protein [Paucibacter sp. Y2R2-4]MCV2351541.1 hypothetical protein [Paucibacter sp. Y2R2-4]